MIKSEDLRRGNKVFSAKDNGYDRAGIITVETIGRTGINQWSDMGASGEIKYEDLAGIPLTEDILLECGFVKKCGVGYLKDDIRIIFDNKDDIDFFRFEYFNTLKKIDFAHQLQNLFHALTGEELTVQL